MCLPEAERTAIGFATSFATSFAGRAARLLIATSASSNRSPGF